MKFDLVHDHAHEAYKILTALVTPRPIAWVTTVDEKGVVNAAPFSFFNVFGTDPALVAFAPGDKRPGVPKDTALNIRNQHEFVINMVDEAVAEAMNQTAAALPHGASEIEYAGLTLLPCDTIKTPRIAEAPAALECIEHSTLQIGSNRLIIGIVQCVHVRDGIIDPQTHRLNIDQYNPIGRMASPSWYAHTRDLFEMHRPS